MEYLKQATLWGPCLDITKARRAFGLRCLPKLDEHLNGTNLLIQQQAINSLDECLHDPENVAHALRIGLVRTLIKLLPSRDQLVRQKACSCLRTISNHQIGREEAIKQALPAALSFSLRDEARPVRFHAHRCLLALAQGPEGAMGILDALLVKQLLRRLAREDGEIRAIALETLHNLFQFDRLQGLGAGGLATLMKQLDAEYWAVRWGAAVCIGELSADPAGKLQGNKMNLIPALIKMFDDDVMTVRAAAAAALGFQTITTPGKIQAVKLGLVTKAVKQLDSGCCPCTHEMMLNTLGLLTNLATVPEGRKILLEHHMEVLNICEFHKNYKVASSAKQLVRVIQFMP